MQQGLLLISEMRHPVSQPHPLLPLLLYFVQNLGLLLEQNVLFDLFLQLGLHLLLQRVDLQLHPFLFQLLHPLLVLSLLPICVLEFFEVRSPDRLEMGRQWRLFKTQRQQIDPDLLLYRLVDGLGPFFVGFVLLCYLFDVEVPFRVLLDMVADISNGLLKILVDDLYFDSRLAFKFVLQLRALFLR